MECWRPNSLPGSSTVGRFLAARPSPAGSSQNLLRLLKSLLRFLNTILSRDLHVFDGDDVVLGFVELPPLSKVVGFASVGEGGVGVYLARTDEEGLVWLERYEVVRTEERR